MAGDSDQEVKPCQLNEALDDFEAKLNARLEGDDNQDNSESPANSYRSIPRFKGANPPPPRMVSMMMDKYVPTAVPERNPPPPTEALLTFRSMFSQASAQVATPRALSKSAPDSARGMKKSRPATGSMWFSREQILSSTPRVFTPRAGSSSRPSSSSSSSATNSNALRRCPSSSTRRIYRSTALSYDDARRDLLQQRQSRWRSQGRAGDPPTSLPTPRISGTESSSLSSSSDNPSTLPADWELQRRPDWVPGAPLPPPEVWEQELYPEDVMEELMAMDVRLIASGRLKRRDIL